MFDVINQLLDSLIAGQQLNGDVHLHFPDGTMQTIKVRCGTADEVEEVYAELLRCSCRLP